MRNFAIAAAMIIPILATNAFAASVPAEKMTVTKSFSNSERQMTDTNSCAFEPTAIRGQCKDDTRGNHNSQDDHGGDRGGNDGRR